MESLDSRCSVRTAFVDFRKAFDLVDHNVLFDKQKQYRHGHTADSLLFSRPY